jgi:hypothetical protein
MKNQQAANEARSAQATALWESRRAEIVRLYHQDGLSQAALASHYRIAQAAIFKVLKRLGIKAKSRGRKGEANGRYVHGLSSTLYRKMVKKNCCAECNATENLCVHHKNGNHQDNSKGNLEVLCSPCHSRHHKREWWKKKLLSSQLSQIHHTE